MLSFPRTLLEFKMKHMYLDFRIYLFIYLFYINEPKKKDISYYQLVIAFTEGNSSTDL